MARHKAAALTLALLSPVTAEFLLGDQYLLGSPKFVPQLVQMLLFTAFYGGGALLIREAARRAGRGWPTILTLSLAFAVFEEGLLTQTLFNPHYLGLDLLSFGHIGFLGIGAPWTVYVLTLHVVWSMGTPIAIAEALFGREPWLGKPGRILWSVSLALGAIATFAVSLFLGPTRFVAAPAQLVGAALIVTALIFTAFRFRRPMWTSTSGNTWVAFALGLGTTAAFQVIFHEWSNGSPWLLTGILLVLEAGTAFAVLRLRAPAFGIAAGALITYCGLGMMKAVASGLAGTIEQSVLVLAAVALLTVAARETPARSLSEHA